MQSAQEMELPFAGAAGVFQSQQRSAEERRVEVENERERQRIFGFGRDSVGEGQVDGSCYGGCCSGLSILEAYAGNGFTGGTVSPVLQRSAAASGVSPLLLEGSSPISPLTAEAEGLLNYYYPFQGSGIEQGGQVDLLGRLRSLNIENDIEAEAISGNGNIPSDPWEIWSQHANSGSSEIGPSLRLHTPLGSSDQEMSSSFIPPKNRQMLPNWLRPCRWQQNTLPSRGEALYSEPLNFFSELHHQTANEADELLCFRGKNDIAKEKRTWSFERYEEPPRSILLPPMLPSSLSSISMHSQYKEFSPAANPQCVSAVTFEDSFILQGKLRYLTGRNGFGFQRERKDGKFKLDPRYFPSVIPKYQSLWEIQGYINLVARDQQGCRFLQHKFDEGTRPEREMIFREIIDHIPELMVNPFGNYLVQKVLEVCTEDQRLGIILVLTKNPTELVRISLNMHGTRAVQKLIESLKDQNQTSLVISALQPGFLNLIKDPNGNHVIQRCLQHFNSEDSMFIFEAAVRHCVEIATHRHGCCVLQRCMAHSTGQLQAKLLAEVSVNGLMLAQDAYGNYAVQYVLEMKNERAMEGLKVCFEGRYAQLARQKFSSNVVEKCLCVFDDASRRRIVNELLSVSCFDHLLQDPYANYVIQSALLTSKGQSRNSLAEAIRAHEGVLKTSPYCKRIFTLLNKR